MNPSARQREAAAEQPWDAQLLDSGKLTTSRRDAPVPRFSKQLRTRYLDVDQDPHASPDPLGQQGASRPWATMRSRATIPPSSDSCGFSSPANPPRDAGIAYPTGHRGVPGLKARPSRPVPTLGLQLTPRPSAQRASDREQRLWGIESPRGRRTPSKYSALVPGSGQVKRPSNVVERAAIGRRSSICRGGVGVALAAWDAQREHVLLVRLSCPGLMTGLPLA